MIRSQETGLFEHVGAEKWRKRRKNPRELRLEVLLRKSMDIRCYYCNADQCTCILMHITCEECYSTDTIRYYAS